MNLIQNVLLIVLAIMKVMLFLVKLVHPALKDAVAMMVRCLSVQSIKSHVPRIVSVIPAEEYYIVAKKHVLIQIVVKITMRKAL